MMRFVKRHLAALAICGAFVAATVSTARADEWNKRTEITINDPIQLPTMVLPPGKYILKLLDSPSDRHIVQVFDKTEQHLLTTVLAINNYRLQPTGKSVFSFWETPAGNPPALRAWFYPGDNYGQEFAYPKNMSGQIAILNRVPVPTTSGDDLKTAEITSTAPTEEKTAEPAPEPAPPPPPPPTVTEPQQPAPAPEPAPSAQTPEPAPAPVPSELPHTASSMPLLGLIGIISLATFFALSKK